MSEKPETAFRRKVIAKLKKLPHIKIFSIQQQSICGTLDLLISLAGVFVSLELKSSKGSPSQLQKHNTDEVNRSGGYGFFVYPENFEDVYFKLEKISKRRPINQGEHYEN